MKDELTEVPDELLYKMGMSLGGLRTEAPHEYYEERKREVGMSMTYPADVKKVSAQYKYLQQACWEKFCDNPQIRTSVIDTIGRLAGYGFGVSSDVPEIDDCLRMINDDPRNRVHTMLPKWLARSEIEGELFLVLTIHKDGFVEIDFRDPGTLGGAYSDSGILTLPSKPTMPLIYCFEDGTDMDGNHIERAQIPSIYALRYPEALQELLRNPVRAVDTALLEKQKSRDAAYKPFGGFFRCVVAWDKGFLTKRNIGHLRTVIKWINLYENLKLYEIDHKKSSGAYLWTYSFEDLRSYKVWASMSPEEKRQTGILQPKRPGGSIILPPGMKLEVRNPTLPKISDSDSDIINMVGSGLNTTSSMMMGTESATYASAQASKGPMSDRTKDAIAWFERFLRYDLYDSIFFIRAKMRLLKDTFRVKRCVGFEGRDPIIKKVPVPARDLIDFSFPVSELSDMESLARSLLGVKHGSLVDTMGIPMSEIAKRMGLGNYRKLRQERAVEEEHFPELLATDDQEQMQEEINNKTVGSAK